VATRFRIVAENASFAVEGAVIESLRICFQVDWPSERAFDVWTRRISTWWPVSHSVTGERGLEIVIELCIGRPIIERTTINGKQHQSGEVTVWEPPPPSGIHVAFTTGSRGLD
jgi:hypothetical protein